MVIAIIGMLSSVVLASLNTARVKARNALRSQNIEALRTAFAFLQNEGPLPSSSGGAPGSAGSGWSCVSSTCTGLFAYYNSYRYADASLAPYIKLPADPAGGKDYVGIIYLGSYTPINPYTTNGYYFQWSEEFPVTPTTCAPGVLYDGRVLPGYPNDVWCLLQL